MTEGTMSVIQNVGRKKGNKFFIFEMALRKPISIL